MSEYAVIDVGGTFLKYAIMDAEGSESHVGKVSSFGCTGEEVIELIASTVTDLSHKGHALSGLALSLPGGVDVDRGIWLFGGAFGDIKHVPLQALLSDQLCMPVSIENDVNCVALGELWKGAGQNCKHFICMTIGTGIGGGIVLNGELFRGHHFMAGEFGFMQTQDLDSDDLIESSLHGVAFHRLRKRIANARSENVEDVSGELIFERAVNGEPLESAEIENVYHRLSMGIFNLIATLNPERVLIGGAICQRPGLIDELSERVRSIAERLNPELAKTVDLSPCQLGNDAGRVGALRHWLNLHG